MIERIRSKIAITKKHNMYKILESMYKVNILEELKITQLSA